MPEYPDITIYIERLEEFDFPCGSLLITEASSKKRAALHFVKGRDELDSFDPGGLEVLAASIDEFRSALLDENHTLKRALTDPRIFSGIGNAYSDEILHRARLSPIQLTEKLTEDQVDRLYHAIRGTLGEWTQRLRDEIGTGFPEKVTAFRKDRLSTAAMENPVRFAANRFNAFATPPEKPTIAPSVRPATNFWRIGRCPVC